MDDSAYLEFMNYANEKIQQARQCIVRFCDDKNILEMQKEQLELIFSMFSQIILHINEDDENYSTVSIYMRNVQMLLNEYTEILNQLDNEDFVDINLFITKEIPDVGK